MIDRTDTCDGCTWFVWASDTIARQDREIIELRHKLKLMSDVIGDKPSPRGPLDMKRDAAD